MRELKHCPFCGEEAELKGKRTFYVECKGCLIKTNKYARPKFAIGAWNRRAGEEKYKDETYI